MYFIIHCKECKQPINKFDFGDCYKFDKLKDCCQLSLVDYERQESKRYAYNKACQMAGYKID